MSEDPLEVNPYDAVRGSEAAIAVLKAEGGLSSLAIRTQSVRALRAVQRASRYTNDEDERRALASHAGYWRAVRRVLSGRWEDATLDEFDPTAVATRLSDDELQQHLAADIGLSSAYVDKRQLHVVARQFLAKNCRFAGGTITVDVELLSMPSTKVIETEICGSASAVRLERAVMDNARINLGGTETPDTGSVYIDDILVLGGELVFASRVAAFDAASAAFQPRSGQRAVLAFQTEQASFTDCDLRGLTLRGCSCRRVRFVKCRLQGLAVEASDLGHVDVVDCDDLAGSALNELVESI